MNHKGGREVADHDRGKSEVRERMEERMEERTEERDGRPARIAFLAT